MRSERGYLASKHNELINASKEYDVIIVGAGIAGMSAALLLDSRLKVAIVSKGQLAECSTYKAQGGMAVAVGPDDKVEEHIADTLRVGQGICREEAVKVLTSEGPEALEFLISLGASFSHNEKGLLLTREAGHSRNRVVHYYDYTGKYMAELLASKVNATTNIDRLDSCYLVDIATDQEGCCGCVVALAGKLVYFRSAVVVVATGGYSGLYVRSTNAISSNGDGVAAAYRAGAVIADMEFVQFHPTAFTTKSGRVFLLTEALRGEGAMLLNAAGQRFMSTYHPAGELAPRDEVSRAMLQEAGKQGGKPIGLDARHLGKEYLMDRFRQVYAELAQNNYFMEQDIIPIAPAAHYTIGGIKTDLWGKTNVACLYACGEAAATGVHGANRLASNSLLEGIVFGRRVAASINDNFPAKRMNSGQLACTTGEIGNYHDVSAVRTKLELAAGVVRQGKDLEAALQWVRDSKNSSVIPPDDMQSYSACNAYQLAELLLEAALLRTESRGCHYRLDFPEKNEQDLQKHILQQWGRKTVIQ